MKRQSLRCAVGFLCCACFLLFRGPASGAIVARFSDGNTTTEVDGYRGMAGDGWSGAWTDHGTDATVTDVTPLNDGGNYLSLTVPDGTRQHTLGRTMDRPNARVDLTAEHVVSFDFRIDDITAYALDGYTGTGAAAIRFTNADSNGPNDTKHTWWLAAFNRPNSPISGGNWHVRSGTGVTTGVTSVSTGIAPEQGVTYTFTFYVFPADSQYRFVLADSLGNAWDSDDPDDHGARLNFRNEDPLTRAGDWLSFDMQKPADAVDADFVYSLDSIEVIPEPATLGLIVTALGLAAALRRRRG